MSAEGWWEKVLGEVGECTLIVALREGGEQMEETDWCACEQGHSGSQEGGHFQGGSPHLICFRVAPQEELSKCIWRLRIKMPWSPGCVRFENVSNLSGTVWRGVTRWTEAANSQCGREWENGALAASRGHSSSWD